MKSAAYQDDILKPSTDIFFAQAGIIRLTELLGERGLDAHPEKTSYNVCGTKQYGSNTNKQLKEIPLMFINFSAKRKISDNYLGQILHEDGLESSVRANIEERTGRSKKLYFKQKNSCRNILDARYRSHGSSNDSLGNSFCAEPPARCRHLMA